MEFLKWYSRVALLLALAVLFACVVALLLPIEPMHDGSGPSEGAIVAYSAAMIALVLLAHAGVVTLLFVARARGVAALRKEGRWHLAALGLMAALFVAPMVLRPISQALYQARTDATPWARLCKAIEKGTPADVTQGLARLEPAERTGSSGDDLVERAVSALRLDNLLALQAGGIRAIPPDNPENWVQLVRSAVKSESSPAPGARAAMVNWLLAQGDALHYSLRGHTGDMLVDLPENIDYANEFAQAGLFDALVAHGADVNDCGKDSCPLWWAARFHNAGLLRVFLAHGANVATVDPAKQTTALGEAISSGDPASVGLLLAAGAQATALDGHDDVVTACTSMDPGPEPAEIVARLHAANVRLTPQRAGAITAQLSTKEAACVRGFLPAP